ncbi:UvrD-helicase domain-containing protein [Providencia stuartii]|uniref:UvrD-helicase domain-containing protein n=1 Tax=Providencia stuartii TaxID=588 RepID=UPI00111F5765|nr:UvrD-helicase domain-containing protein [Providencia stuartii]
MKYDFICLSYEATKVIIQARTLQSLDFKNSSFIVNIANGTLPNFENIELPIYHIEKNKGLYILHDDDKYMIERDSVTLDFKALSFDDVDDSMKVTSIQKSLRFCIKYWDNLSYSSSEIIPLDSTKGIIFPFQTRSGSSYKVAIELAPFRNKSNKERKYKGKHLCIYKFGQNSGAKNKEECEVGVLKRALDGLYSVDLFKNTHKKTSEKNKENISGAVNLGENDLLNTTVLLGRNNPFELLSDKQLAFVDANWKLPARLHGPAGSGKTICLVLKALRAITSGDYKLKVLFIVPSTAVKNTVEYFLKVTAKSSESFYDAQLSQIRVRTIQQVCMEQLGNDVSQTELLDEDSYEAKQTQLLYIMEIVEKVQSELKNHKNIISQELYDLFNIEDSFALSELLIHEFGVAIKGRCGNSKEEYVSDKYEQFTLPTQTEDDRYFIFKIFEDYQLKLDALSQFDPDDIALSAIGRLESPLWKRRRNTEGYDFIIIDELHLLNFNELSIIHYLTKENTSAPISFAVDATQAIGDIAWKNDSILDYLNIADHSSLEEKTDLTIVFRCSTSITKLASMITSSGTSLFTNFIDPLAQATDIQIELEEYKPEYILYDQSNRSIHQKAIDLASTVQRDLNCMKHRIVIIYFDRLLYEDAKTEFEQQNRPVSYLHQRGDIEVIEDAKNKNDYIVAMADYVGGLEFDAVILVGVDKGRLPREDRSISNTSNIFQNYTAHNRMYVAITRATKIVKIIGESRRGPSPLLGAAISAGVIQRLDMS